MDSDSTRPRVYPALPETARLVKEAYGKYFRMWINLAKTVEVSDDDARDLVHTILYAVLSDIDIRFESLEHVRNYIARAVLNRSIQHRQKSRKRAGWTELTDGQFPVNPEGILSEEAREGEALRKAIKGLSKRDFEIIKLRFYSGLTFNEISQMLSLSISTLKSREEAALKRIRICLRKMDA